MYSCRRKRQIGLRLKSNKGSSGWFNDMLKNCPNLEEVYLPNQQISSTNFGNFEASTKVVFKADDDNPYYTIRNNCVLNKKGDRICCVKDSGLDSSMNFTNPSGIVGIEAYAFVGCNVKEFTFTPAYTSTASIGQYCFKGCKNLTSVTINHTQKVSLGAYCFQNCTELKNLDFEKVSFNGSYIFQNTGFEEISIQYNAQSLFSDCKKLVKATITGNRVYSYLFSGCTALKEVTFTQDAVQLEPYALFSNCSSLEVINFPNSVTFSSSANHGYTFRGCSKLTSLVLPTGFNKIGTYGLCDMPSLEYLDLPEGFNEFGDILESVPKLKTIICRATSAPKTSNNTFGRASNSYVGIETKSTGENTLYVPQGATGYDTGRWLDPLQNPDKCGFTLSATL